MTFYGWSTTEDGSTLWNYAEDRMPLGDLTLYAVWRYDFTSEAVEGGMHLRSYTGSKTTIRVPEWIDDQPVLSIAEDAFPDPTVTLTGNKGSVTENYALAQGMTFVPLRYEATFISNGGTVIAPQTLCATDYLVQPEILRSGYTLLGWFTDSTLRVRWDFAQDRMPAAPLTLYAAWEKSDETFADIPFTFEPTENGLSITGYTGTSAHAILPASINGETVCAIADFAFFENQSLLSLSIPGTVQTIGRSSFAGSRLSSISIDEGLVSIDAHAFSGCAELHSVMLPESLLSLGDAAFQDCTALTSLQLPNHLTVLPKNLFSGCTFLSSISLPSALETISSSAFADCTHITKLTLGTHVYALAPDAFSGCTSLDAVHVAADNMYFTDVNGVVLSADGTQLLLYPCGKASGTYTLPATVSAIGERAMASSRITSLVCNDALTLIAPDALRGSTQLQSIVFASDGHLTEIGASAFSGCVALDSIIFPDTLRTIHANAFSLCTLQSVTIPAHTTIGAHAFDASPHLTLYGANGSPAATYAQTNGLRFVDLSTDIPVIGVTLPPSLSLAPGENCTLSAVLMPHNTTETTLRWNSSDASIAYVDANGFVSARSIGTATVSVTAANGSSASCLVTVAHAVIAPEQIVLSADVLTLVPGNIHPLSAQLLPVGTTDEVKWHSSDNAVVRYASGCVFALSCGTATLTATVGDTLRASCTVTVVPAWGTPDLTLPASLRQIDAEAFLALPVKVVLCPNGLESINSRAFAHCTALTQIYIPASVTVIADDAFSGCTNLVIFGTSASPAQTFAQTHGYPFVAQ